MLMRVTLRHMNLIARASRPSESQAALAQFALLADPLRFAIVQALAREQLCTCHLVDITGARQTAISNHLRLLRDAGVVTTEPEGRFTWYRLAPGALADALDALGSLVASGAETPRLRPACAT